MSWNVLGGKLEGESERRRDSAKGLEHKSISHRNGRWRLGRISGRDRWGTEVRPLSEARRDSPAMADNRFSNPRVMF